MNITQHFIDERFKAYVLEQFCGNREWIETSDVDQVQSLKLSNHCYSSLKGIEHFASLEELDCSNNLLTELNVSNNANLRSLNCGFNRLRKLDVSCNALLAKLDCCWNILSELHLARNTQLKELKCSYNSMFDLKLDDNDQLTHLDCGSNYLISLNINACPDLIEIRCNNNHLTSLDITGNPALQSLRCFNNHITALDLSHSPLLKELYCSENKISALDTRHNPMLERMSYANNLIVEPNHTVEGFGIFQYDVSLTSYTSALIYKEKEISVHTDVSTNSEMKQLSPFVIKVWEHFDVLTDKALSLIADTHPDEDVNELILSDLAFDRDGSFRIGYDAGETPAGHLYIYAAFSNKLEMNGELIYETY